MASTWPTCARRSPLDCQEAGADAGAAMIIRRLQPFRYLHDCSGCFRLERSPGGICTHWKAPPCHGARDKRTGELFSYVDLEKRVRSGHPLRAIGGLVNEALAPLEHEFSALYAPICRP